MARPRFSEMLLQRRRELGLTCSQASQILKLREDVLVAFEEGDWQRIPQSGYAQGMLSSYARYLGLNAREIVDLFQEELFEYQHGSSSHALRRRTRDTQMGRGISGYDVPNEADSRPKAYVQYRPLLPTSGGPAGDMGDFATTTPARSRGSVPLAGAGAAAPGTRGYQYQPPAAPAQPDYAQRRPYNAPARSERPQPSTARRRSQQPARRRTTTDPADRLLSEDRYAPGRGEWRRDDVSTRRVRPSEYTDDLRYDDRATSFAPASTISGRRSSRNIAPVERPNVRRRAGSGSGSAVRAGRGGRRPPARGGLVGAVQGFFSDPRRALFALIVLLAAVLTAILVFSVSSCVGNTGGTPTGGQTVQVNNAGTTGGAATTTTGGDTDASDEGGSGADATDGERDKADADTTGGADDADDADAPAEEEPKETVVKISLASGTSSWVEVVCDGVSEEADTLVGPWEASYTVYDSLSISVTDPDAVTVTNNGEKVAFTSKVGSMGTITIKGTPKPEGEEGAEGASETGDAAGTSANGTTTTRTGTGA